MNHCNNALLDGTTLSEIDKLQCVLWHSFELAQRELSVPRIHSSVDISPVLARIHSLYLTCTGLAPLIAPLVTYGMYLLAFVDYIRTHW